MLDPADRARQAQDTGRSRGLAAFLHRHDDLDEDCYTILGRCLDVDWLARRATLRW